MGRVTTQPTIRGSGAWRVHKVTVARCLEADNVGSSTSAATGREGRRSLPPRCARRVRLAGPANPAGTGSTGHAPHVLQDSEMALHLTGRAVGVPGSQVVQEPVARAQDDAVGRRTAVMTRSAPDDVGPGAGEDAGGVGVVAAAGDGLVVVAGGPGAGAAGVSGKVAQGVAELLAGQERSVPRVLRLPGRRSPRRHVGRARHDLRPARQLRQKRGRRGQPDGGHRRELRSVPDLPGFPALPRLGAGGAGRRQRPWWSCCWAGPVARSRPGSPPR